MERRQRRPLHDSIQSARGMAGRRDLHSLDPVPQTGGSTTLHSPGTSDRRDSHPRPGLGRPACISQHLSRKKRRRLALHQRAPVRDNRAISPLRAPGWEGFEPPQTDLETVMLPLHHHPYRGARSRPTGRRKCCAGQDGQAQPIEIAPTPLRSLARRCWDGGIWARPRGCVGYSFRTSCL